MLYIFVAPYPATYCRATIWGIDITSGCIELQATCDNVSVDLFINVGYYGINLVEKPFNRSELAAKLQIQEKL